MKEFCLVIRVRYFSFSKLKARDKAIKNRTRVAQSLDKLQHSQRQEAAKQRREEKKKLEKERMMNETDPEKTRKWEVRHHKFW